VTRSALATRPACLEDLQDLVGLWTQLREAGGRAARSVHPANPADAEARLRAVLADPEHRVVLCHLDGAPAGMAILTDVGMGPLTDHRAIQLSAVAVEDSHRRRGVGRALVAAALAYADEVGRDQIVVSLYPALRDAQRFYARLGFTPLVLRRVAPVAVVRRRLGLPERRSAHDLVPLRARVRRSRLTPRRALERR